MILNEQEIKFLKLIAERFEKNKIFIERQEVIKELQIDSDTYEVLVRKMLHLCAIEKIESNMRDGRYAAFRTSPRSVELVREIEAADNIEPKTPEILQKILWILKYGRRHWKLLFVAVFFFLCIWILQKINLFSRIYQNNNSETKTNKTVEDITLLYLFENDFKNLLRVGEDRILTYKEGSQTTIKSKLYLDFESQTEFVSFYIPSVPETLDICTYLAEHYKTAFELKKTVMVESSGPGLQPVNISELKFSGRVFIYHEYPLLEAQKRELFALYKKHDLSLQFRSTDYLFEKKQIGKK